MAVSLQFEICQSSDCSTLTFKETTGAYNSLSNLTGWGSPNETVGAATAATLTVTFASGTAYTINLLTVGFPTADSTIEYEIPGSSIGNSSNSAIADQVITFTYTVTTETSTYTQTIQQAFYCNAQCCVLSMFADLDVECDCSEDQIANALKAYALFKGLVYAANCGSTNNFNSILAQVNKLCVNSNCTNCN